MWLRNQPITFPEVSSALCNTTVSPGACLRGELTDHFRYHCKNHDLWRPPEAGPTKLLKTLQCPSKNSSRILFFNFFTFLSNPLRTCSVLVYSSLNWVMPISRIKTILEPLHRGNFRIKYTNCSWTPVRTTRRSIWIQTDSPQNLFTKTNND